MEKKNCRVCPHHCLLSEGKTGICKARAGGGMAGLSGKRNVDLPSLGAPANVGRPNADLDEAGTDGWSDGRIFDAESICLNYGEVTSLALDPIEKKPLRRFFPGSQILSVGSWGCNMKCPWCQNDSISRGRTRHIRMSPEELLTEALSYKTNIGLAFTYNEPLIGYEFVRDTAKLVREAGMKNVLVSNGLISETIFSELLPYLDAMNIDLKTINAEKYRSIGGDLDTILSNIREGAHSAHVELTTLIVPGFNDSEEEMEALVERVASISREIPLHVTRFFPAGEMRDAAPTPRKTLFRMVEIAERHLKHVYPGNI